jgi:AcrR family transcriptional regulator
MGTMSVKENIQDVFRKLAISLPYKKITVSMICREARVSRATFYDLFDNKEAIIRGIVIDDIISPQKTLQQMMTRFKSSSQIAMELHYASIKDNATFYKSVNRAESGYLLTHVLTDEFMVMTHSLLQECDLPDDELRYAVFFFAASNAELISRWLKNNLDLEPARIGSLFNKWTMHYWEDILQHKLSWHQH